MEVAVLAGLAGLGYAVTRATDKPKKTEGFQNTMQSMAPAQSPAPVDQAFKTFGDKIHRSEPNPGKQGTAFNYATLQVDNPVPRVAMRADHIEQQPNYTAKENNGAGVYSALLGKYIDSKDFTHANMVPFYGGSVKQNVASKTNQSRLDTYSGIGSYQIEKREVETMFDTGKTPYGSPYGLEMKTEYVQDRIVAPRNRAGERPFEPTHVAPGVGLGGGSLGQGGYQQLEINEIMRPRGTDDLRTADNPKMTYKGVVVPGKHFIGKGAEEVGEVRKYRPDTFYIDETGERLWATPAGEIKEMARSAQIIVDTTRQETSQEYIGSGAAQGFGESYVAGSYRTPMTNQFGGAGYRNANMEGFYTPFVDSPEADYGRGSFENKPNERTATTDRGMALNMAPADTGAVMVHYEDSARPTRRGDIIGTARPVGIVGVQTPAVTVWDPQDVARTTIREGTIELDRFGVAASASAPTRLKVYDPADIARHTQKEKLSTKSYTGNARAVGADALMNQTAARNMVQSAEREATLFKRQPKAGNGGIAIFNGTINQTSKSITADILNDRALGVNRVTGLPPGKADIGVAKLRVPLHLNQSTDRFGPEMVAALDSNPYARQFKFSA